jgi:hypothetical protein
MPTLGTGTDTPIGPQVSGEDLYIEGGPTIWFQNSGATEENHPDSDGYYWGLSGTATYPVYPMGCYDDLTIADTRTTNPVTCAALGDVAQMQRRDAFEITFTLKALFPLATLRYLIGGGAVVHNAAEETEKMGLGNLPINQFFHLHLARVYDEDTGDYLAITFHKVQFMDATPLAMPYGNVWTYVIKGMALADTTMPKEQRFATMLRYDPSVL